MGGVQCTPLRLYVKNYRPSLSYESFVTVIREKAMQSRKRHPYNSNLHLFQGDTWRHRPVYSSGTQGLVEDYLLKIDQVITRALEEHPRTFAIRVDLRYPGFFDESAIKHDDITRFIKSLKSQLEADARRKESEGKRVHPCTLRYVWAKEQCSSEHPHFHVILLLNRDRYNGLGDFTSPSHQDGLRGQAFNEPALNLSGRIIRAWASALDLDDRDAQALVHFCQDGCYRVNHNDPEGLDALFERVSYLAKVETKRYGTGHRCFGSSQV